MDSMGPGQPMAGGIPNTQVFHSPDDASVLPHQVTVTTGGTRQSTPDYPTGDARMIQLQPGTGGLPISTPYSDHHPQTLYPTKQAAWPIAPANTCSLGYSTAVDRSSANSPEATKDCWKITLTPPNAQETNSIPPGSSLCQNSLLWPTDTRANAESAYQKLLERVFCVNKDVDKRLEAVRERPREICDGLYEVGRKIGEGSFGVVFEGIMRLEQKEVAIKFEPRNSGKLRNEYYTYKALSGSVGIPNAYYFGQVQLHDVLILDRLGPSLESVFDDCGRSFSSKTVWMLAKQMISRIRDLHVENFIHRDLKPENFLIGTRERDRTYLTDFGMVKRYRDPRTEQHIPKKGNNSLAGTARYMSINAHLRKEQSRKDDLEALGYIFLYFLRGRLPWQGIKALTKDEKFENIGRKKRETALEELCEGCPVVRSYLQYASNLGFEEDPDYDHLQRLFSDALKDEGEEDDGRYCWISE